MKKLIVVMIASLALSGCGTFFGTYKNPVSPNDLDKVKMTYRVVLDGAVVYRDLCDKKVIARVKCAPVVNQLMKADDKVKLTVRNLEKFVRENPTISAVSLIEAVKDAVDDFRAIANDYGVIK